MLVATSGLWVSQVQKLHVLDALRYIPDRVAGVAMFAPMINPYDPSMT